jgi:ABC-2 type transport system permease protein
VISAIFKKDLQVFLSYPLNAVMRLVEPIMWITPMYFMAQSFQVDGVNPGLAAYTGSGDYMAYYLLGSLISSYVSAVAWGMGFSLKNEMDAGVLESNWLTPASVLVQLIGRSCFSIFLTTLNSVGVIMFVWLLFGIDFFSFAGPALLILVPLIVALYGFGFGLAAVVLITNNANNVIDISNSLLTVISGSNFPITVMPRVMQAVALALPLTYAYDAIRGYLLGTSTLLPLNIELLILLVFMIVFFVLGFLLFRRIERRCRDLGTLSQH